MIHCIECSQVECKNYGFNRTVEICFSFSLGPRPYKNRMTNCIECADSGCRFYGVSQCACRYFQGRGCAPKSNCMNCGDHRCSSNHTKYSGTCSRWFPERTSMKAVLNYCGFKMEMVVQCRNGYPRQSIEVARMKPISLAYEFKPSDEIKMPEITTMHFELDEIKDNVATYRFID